MSLISNFFPISIPFEEFDISRVPYTQERLNSLRDSYNETHSFFRNGDWIYISPMKDSQFSGGDYVTLNVQENQEIVSSLIKHIFFRTFKSNFPDIVPLSFYPFRILSRKSEDDIIASLLDSDLENKLSRKKLIEVQFRNIKDQDSKILNGAVINLRYKWLFELNCQELLNEGFNITGLKVLIKEPLPGLDGILAPDESLIGILKSVESSYAIVDTNEGDQKLPLDELYLHKSTSNIASYLTFKYSEERKDQIFDSLKKKDKTRLNAKNYFKEIFKISKKFSGFQYYNKDGFLFNIAHNPKAVNENLKIHKPRFIFDHNPGATSKYATSGLINYGPYDSSTFDNKSPKVLVICHKSNRGSFSNFVGKLKNGIPSSRYFKGGIVNKYNLHDINFQLIQIDSYKSEDYINAFRKYTQEFQTPDFVIAETRQDFRDKKTTNNPYYKLKAHLLSHGITAQFIKAENTRLGENKLQWICDSVALQIYAKLGGIPWVLPTNSSIDHEIVVGIGSSLIRSNTFKANDQRRVVGITTFFSGDGKYLMGNRCEEVPYEKYFDTLLNNLKNSINQISDEYGWQKNDTVRIVFHVFKPLKNIEVDVVNNLVEQYGNYNIQFCFVTISEYHPFLIFNTEQNGTGYNKRGEYVPDRGTNWLIQRNKCLLQLKGPKDIKSKYHSFSSPVLIKIHQNSTFVDINYITQQVMHFTNLSWRGFFPTQIPATILYSDLIAKKLSRMKKIKSWNPEIVNTQLKHKKWFL